MKPIKNIDINKVMSDLKKQQASFEVDPLDVNIAKIQFNLLNRLEREVPEYGCFAPVIEKYTSKNPDLNIGDIIVKCSHVKDSLSKLDRTLDLTVVDRFNPNKQMNLNIAKGTKKDVMESVKQREFFAICKNAALNFNEQLKK